MKRIKGQTVLEFVVLTTIVIGALLAIGNYFKRGIQGRWKQSVDDLGSQYDPRATNTSITQTLLANTDVRVYSDFSSSGDLWTMRHDVTNSVETKTGFSRIGAY